MAQFDFIESATQGYKFLWYERQAIMQLATIPLVLKVIGFFTIVFFDIEENFLRQGLVLLPSHFAEGWLVAQLIRMAVFGERWPAPLSGDQKKDEALVYSRGRSILSAMVFYVLIKLALSFSTGIMFMENLVHVPDGAAAEPSVVTFMVALMVVGFFIWAFRFLWLFIPAALDYSIIGFLKAIRGYNTSVYMIAAWLLCFVPLALLLLGVSEMVSSAFPGQGEEPSTAYTYIILVFQALLEMWVAVVSSIAMAYGIQSIYHSDNDTII